MTSEHQGYKISIPILIIFFILSVYIIVMGYLYHSKEKKEIKANAQKELTAIAELKVVEMMLKARIKSLENKHLNPRIPLQLNMMYLIQYQDNL